MCAKKEGKHQTSEIADVNRNLITSHRSLPPAHRILGNIDTSYFIYDSDNYPSMENQTFLRAHFMMMMMSIAGWWRGKQENIYARDNLHFLAFYNRTHVGRPMIQYICVMLCCRQGFRYFLNRDNIFFVKGISAECEHSMLEILLCQKVFRKTFECSNFRFYLFVHGGMYMNVILKTPSWGNSEVNIRHKIPSPGTQWR